MLYTLGHVRDPAIKYIVAGGAIQERSLYFWSAYSNVADVVSTARHTLVFAHILIYLPFADLCVLQRLLCGALAGKRV